VGLNLRTGTDPAANVEITETLTTTFKQVYAVRFRLVTDANAANRTVNLIIDDGTNILWQKAAGAVQAASLTRDYLFTTGVTDGAAFDANGLIVMALPPYFPMLPGFRIRTTTTNRQVGDNFGAPLMLTLDVSGTDDSVISW
jgi:hypothetical protein